MYGSVGKGGLYIPSDFIGSSSNRQQFQDDITADENSPLLDIQGTQAAVVDSNPNPFKNRRKLSVVARELLEQERELLQENHIAVDDLKSDDEVRDAFEEAVQNKQIEVTTPLIELKTLISSAIPSVVTFLLQCFHGVCFQCWSHWCN